MFNPIEEVEKDGLIPWSNWKLIVFQ